MVKQLVAHCNSGLVQIYPWWSGALEIGELGTTIRDDTIPVKEETNRRLLKTLQVDPGTRVLLI